MRNAPDEVVAFGREFARRLSVSLGGDLLGAYFVGSVALGGYVAGQSDLDIVGVCEHRVPAELRPEIAQTLLERTAGCPTRGLEFTLYRRDVVASPPLGADFEMNVNGGPGMPPSVHLDPAPEPPFWYVIDRAIACRVGVAIVGPPAAEVFSDVPREVLLAAMRDSMRWHREYERATLYSVLNACRAWRFATEGTLGSKLGGAGWARVRWCRPDIIDAAVALRHGRPADLDAHAVDELLEHVAGVLAGAQR